MNTYEIKEDWGKLSSSFVPRSFNSVRQLRQHCLFLELVIFLFPMQMSLSKQVCGLLENTRQYEVNAFENPPVNCKPRETRNPSSGLSVSLTVLLGLSTWPSPMVRACDTTPMEAGRTWALTMKVKKKPVTSVTSSCSNSGKTFEILWHTSDIYLGNCIVCFCEKLHGSHDVGLRICSSWHSQAKGREDRIFRVTWCNMKFDAEELLSWTELCVYCKICMYSQWVNESMSQWMSMSSATRTFEHFEAFWCHFNGSH